MAQYLRALCVNLSTFSDRLEKFELSFHLAFAKVVRILAVG
jgi:hypothetical protein